jgi:phosphate transport system protein
MNGMQKRSSAQAKRVQGPESIPQAAARACLVAKDAAANLHEFIISSTRMAYLTVQQCERELDQIEREIDETLPAAITRVNESRARELLASQKFITDLERIGDLLLWVGNRASQDKLDDQDATRVASMIATLEVMLEKAHEGFVTRDRDLADEVLRMDPEIDRQRTMLFEEHLRARGKRKNENIGALFIAQSIERAGDHTTNLAEEIIHLVEGRSIRHTKGKPVEV